jgi:hypothetical protein
MMHFCTTSDSNYLLKGLSLYQSIKDTHGEIFELFWLCIDDDCFNTLTRINLQGVRPISLSVLEAMDPALNQAKKNPPTKYGSQRDNYIWSLTPYFINHILEGYIKSDEYLMYCDSDICFYHDPEIINNAVLPKSIGIHTHRFGPKRTKLDVGWYNVGVTVFRKDVAGRLASRQWRQWSLDGENGDYYEEYGTCGDQKFLELFPQLFTQDVCVFDDDVRISHRAPWCCDEDGKPVIFYHFSHFVHDIDKGTWRDSLNGEWRPSKHSHIKPYYDNYFELIKKVSTFIK